MTDTQITNGESGVKLHKRPDAVRHAYVEGGEIHLLQSGRLRPVSRWDAISALLDVDTSPCPSSQERASQIRAALRETTQ